MPFWMDGRIPLEFGESDIGPAIAVDPVLKRGFLLHRSFHITVGVESDQPTMKGGPLCETVMGKESTWIRS